MVDWRRYLRCDECGAEARRCCRDDDDRPASAPCAGRQLRSATRPVTVTVDNVGRPRRRKRGVPAEPTYWPCQHCGQPARVIGAAWVCGEAWCLAPACRAARDERYRARRRERERAASAARPLVEVRCYWCDCLIRLATEPPRRRSWCDDPACRRAARRIGRSLGSPDPAQRSPDPVIRSPQRSPDPRI